MNATKAEDSAKKNENVDLREGKESVSEIVDLKEEKKLTDEIVGLRDRLVEKSTSRRWAVCLSSRLFKLSISVNCIPTVNE